jgi:hypothetical protein
LKLRLNEQCEQDRISKHEHKFNKHFYRVCDNVLKVKPCLREIIRKIEF